MKGKQKMSKEYNIINDKIIIKDKNDNYYHGSDSIIKKPDLKHSRDNIDFNKGFYLTNSIYQAHKWACQRKNTQNTSITNIYRLDFTNLNVKHFDLDLDWLEYVVANRTRTNTPKSYKEFDIIIGPIADDKLFDTINMYQDGLLSAENALKIMNCMDYGEQIVLKTDKALENITFLSYKELKGLEKQNYVDAFRQDTIEASRKTAEMLKIINQGKQP